MADDDRSIMDVNKVQDINANGLPNPLSGLCIPTATKRESKEQLSQESDSIHIQRWPGRDSLSNYTMEMEDKTRQQQHCGSFSLTDGRDSMLNTVPISTPNHFLSGMNHQIGNQHSYIYRGEQLFNHNVTRSAQLSDLKPQMCGSPLQQQQSTEDPHCNSVSSSNHSFSISQIHEDKPLLQDSNLTEESAVDTSASSPPASVECIVCGDKSSGKHYGQYTCEGCKSFFKRSVRRNLNYTCRGSRNCPVDLQHRNQCQYCRFQKCVKLGMRREAVQKGRVPQNNMLVYQQHIGCSLTPWPPQDPSHHPIQGVAIIPSYNHAPLISSLIKADDLFPSRFPVPRVNNLVDQSSHLLLGIIEWAKRLPSFSDFDIHDQVALLKNCWPDLFLISAVQVSMPLPVSQMVSTCLSPETDRVTVMSQLVDHSHILQNQLERLKILSLDVAEFASLKAILLFNPDTIGIASNSQVEAMQEKIHSALEEYMRLHYPNQVSRFGKMLLRLPTLSKASSQIIEQLILMRLVNRDSVDSLIQNFLLRSINLSTNSSHSLPNGLSSFGSVGSAASSLPSISPHTTATAILPSNNLATAVLTPQLPSPCLPQSNAPSTPSCTVSHQSLHTSTPIANHWLNTSPACIDSSSMRLHLPGNTDVNLNTLISQQHQSL